jgi:hypothetical protein
MAYERHKGVGGIIELAAVIVAIILVLHIIFVLIGANGNNSIVSTDASWARHLAAWFQNLFTSSSAKWNTVLNYGIATLVYLAVGRIIGGAVERL